LLVAGCWLLVAGCWLLVAGCWLLVAGCWLYKSQIYKGLVAVKIEDFKRVEGEGSASCFPMRSKAPHTPRGAFPCMLCYLSYAEKG